MKKLILIFLLTTVSFIATAQEDSTVFSSLQVMVDSINARFKTKAAINAGASKNDPDDFNYIVRSIAATLFSKTDTVNILATQYDLEQVIAAGGGYTQEQIEDFIGAMLSGNTETLITATYQDADGTIDLVVDDDLANYDNTTSGFLTASGALTGTFDGQEGSYYLDYSNHTNTPSLATVATTGAYSDLSGAPTLATVATSGDYDDLSNLPDLSGYLDMTDTVSTLATLYDLEQVVAGGGGYTQEEIEDFVGGMVTGNTETGITVTYDDTDGTLDFVVSGGGGFTQEEIEDFNGAMFSGNTETLITATYQDADGTIDLVVDNDLANYDNSTSGFLDASDIGSTVQAFDSDLSTYAGITPSANIQSLLGAANYAAMRTLLDLEAGTDFYSISGADAAFQPLDSDLTTYAGITPSANVQSLLGAANYSAYRSLLGGTPFTNTVSSATGDETLFTFNGTVNKATSGNYTGLLVNVTETNAPGLLDRLVKVQRGGTDYFTISNSGAVNIMQAGALSIESSDGDAGLSFSEASSSSKGGFKYDDANNALEIYHSTGHIFLDMGRATNDDITITPMGTGNIYLGNFPFDADQTVGAGQDNYVFKYNHTGTLVSLEQIDYSEIANTPSLATVATSGAYADLSGTPSLATVATSGDYDDLTNKPTEVKYVTIALSDMTNEMTTGLSQIYYDIPFAATITGVHLSVKTAPIGSAISLDILEEGVSILSTEVTIDDGETKSSTAATPAVISDSSLAQWGRLTFSVSQIGASTPGTGPIITLIVEPL